MKILIADDNVNRRRGLARLVERGMPGATLHETGNVADAFVVYATERPDAVVTDWAMPMNRRGAPVEDAGDTLVRICREGCVPVHVLSGGAARQLENDVPWTHDGGVVYRWLQQLRAVLEPAEPEARPALDIEAVIDALTAQEVAWYLEEVEDEDGRAGVYGEVRKGDGRFITVWADGAVELGSAADDEIEGHKAGSVEEAASLCAAHVGDAS